jgi:phosphate transport system substrate-binding protein
MTIRDERPAGHHAGDAGKNLLRGSSRRAVWTIALCLLSFAATPRLANAVDQVLRESGSTLLFPLFSLWIPDYTAANPGVTIKPEATGSGSGIDEAIAGHVQIGASDAYMSDEQAERNRQIVNIPLAISALTVNYNLPGMTGTALKLDGPALAGIYSGRIGTWDDPAIAALNPGVQLPHQAVIPVRRSDASGDTFVFTQFLDFSTQTWENAVGYGTSVSWPKAAGEQDATGNDGMVKKIAATPYAVGYAGISFHDEIAKAGVGTALLKNQAGKFLLPTAETVSDAASELDPRTPPDERLSLVFAPGDNSYPLINYEYAVVSTQQSNPDTADAMRRFLLWAISLEGGNAQKYMSAVQFIPLPDFIRAMSEKQIKKIRSNNS